MARKSTPVTTPVTTTPVTTPVTTTPKFREIDSTQLLTHIRKMDLIHQSKSTTRKFAAFVNLSVNEIAEILGNAQIENVNSAINVFVNAKSVENINAAIAAGTIETLTIRKK